jgi:hypothetical protein
MPVPYRLPLPLFLSARFLGIIELCSCSSKIFGKWIGFVMESLTELWFHFFFLWGLVRLVMQKFNGSSENSWDAGRAQEAAVGAVTFLSAGVPS